ncbi:hypothetical protein Q0M94_12010 [Deinococcus radiomollis]|uniref:hypothetical protein n=1 Tax=Deinococcus radiomollis TaxID=468916 RepID=UPI00389245DD
MTPTDPATCAHEWEFIALRRGEHLCIDKCKHCEEVRRYTEWFPATSGERFQVCVRPHASGTKEAVLLGKTYVFIGVVPAIPDVLLARPVGSTELHAFDPFLYTFSPEMP